MDKYEFNVATSELYNFIWDDFCDWYIELAKANMNNQTKAVLLKTLTSILKLLHPIMPYVTEEIYQKLPVHEKTIMLSEYPVYNKNEVYDLKEMELVIEFIKNIRKIKIENNLKNDFLVVYDDEVIEKNKDLIIHQLKLQDRLISSQDYQIDERLSKIALSFNNKVVDIYYDGSLGEEEIALLKQEEDKLIQSIARREKLLSNENYVQKAPQNIVDAERENLEKEKNRLLVIQEQLQK